MILVPRGKPDDFWLKERGPLWRPARLPDGRRTATMSCPNGHVASLSQHAIDAEGRVTPSVQCPFPLDGMQYMCPKPECGFHDHVQLAGWQP